MKDFTSCFGTLVLWVVLMILGVFIKGFVLSNLWDWYVVSIFELPQLSYLHAVGLSLLIGYISGNFNINDEKTVKSKDATETVVNHILQLIIAPLLILFAGYLYHFFI